MSSLTVLILAAGNSSRMKSDTPKPLHEIAGRSMIGHVIDTAETLDPKNIFVVRSPKGDMFEKAVLPYKCVIQQEALGTGHAVKEGLAGIKGIGKNVLVLYGDTPFITPKTLKKMLKNHVDRKSSLSVLGFDAKDPKQYGRLVTGAKNVLHKITEFKDADAETRKITLCNSGVMLMESKALKAGLEALKNDNAAGEYYLTDLVEIFNKQGLSCHYSDADEDELLGVNDRIELARAEKIMQNILRENALKKGVTLTDPDTVYLCKDTKFGKDVIVGPFTVFGPNVTIGSGTEIRAFTHLHGVKIGKDCAIGPYARIRPGTVIGDHTKVGNFVEMKNAKIGDHVGASHLSYVGDAFVGDHSNLGAGTITCNYDGYQKSQTRIGEDVFVGSNSALVAPVSIDDGAIIAAGSVITKNVEKDDLAVARGTQKNFTGKAAPIKAQKKTEKEGLKKAKKK